MKPTEMISKTVALVNPQPGEEKLLYKVVDANDVTGRVHIQCQNLCTSFVPIECVDMSEVVIYDNIHFVTPKL